MIIVTTKKKYSGETKVISARLPIELVQKLDDVAKQSNRNRSDIIKICIEQIETK